MAAVAVRNHRKKTISSSQSPQAPKTQLHRSTTSLSVVGAATDGLKIASGAFQPPQTISKGGLKQPNIREGDRGLRYHFFRYRYDTDTIQVYIFDTDTDTDTKQL